uniref:Uncharacterized protein n=1 Tax=Trichuris muris TaxID=70415 RepID=A0A5S6Q472_TRIMR
MVGRDCPLKLYQRAEANTARSRLTKSVPALPVKWMCASSKTFSRYATAADAFMQANGIVYRERIYLCGKDMVLDLNHASAHGGAHGEPAAKS